MEAALYLQPFTLVRQRLRHLTKEWDSLTWTGKGLLSLEKEEFRDLVLFHQSRGCQSQGEVAYAIGVCRSTFSSIFNQKGLKSEDFGWKRGASPTGRKPQPNTKAEMAEDFADILKDLFGKYGLPPYSGVG